jgi:hypothetical protein
MLPAPVMVSGDDLAFRVQSYGPPGTARGRWMVRANGVWHQAVTAPNVTDSQ